MAIGAGAIGAALASFFTSIWTSIQNWINANKLAEAEAKLKAIEEQKKAEEERLAAEKASADAAQAVIDQTRKDAQTISPAEMLEELRRDNE